MIPEKVIVDAEKCTECLSCQLICSLTFSQRFNPQDSRIIVEPINGGRRIDFTDDCTECYLCVKYCLHGAITLKEG